MAYDFQDLIDFINKARAAGKSTEDVRNLLTKAGWSGAQIDPYLVGGDLIPPPPPSSRETGRDIFFSLLTFFTLGISAVSLGSILFSIITYFLPDQVVGSVYRSTGLSWAIASFLVAAPVYVWSGWKRLHDMAQGLTDVHSRLSRALTYLALFIASATVIGDVIALLYNFLSGEVTVRFLLKVAVILALGGWIIWYYWIGMKQDQAGGTGTSFKFRRAHTVAFAVVAVAAVITGFVLSGSPGYQQKVVRDETRQQQLAQIQNSIQEYYNLKKALPDDIGQLNWGYGSSGPLDPSSGAPYEYQKVAATAYKLCAVFESEAPEVLNSNPVKVMPLEYGNIWSHPVGRYCFSLEVVPSEKK